MEHFFTFHTNFIIKVIFVFILIVYVRVAVRIVKYS
jgi:hypothetical protein